MIAPQVIRTKIAPPRKAARLLVRPRITRALADAQHYRLTILQAGAGYGKSTALAALAEAGIHSSGNRSQKKTAIHWFF